MKAEVQREEAVFEAALRLPKEQRRAYLESACCGAPELLQQVEALLAAHEHTSGPLEVATIELTRTLVCKPLSEVPGDIIGRYKLLQQIGEGGCGVVYVAEQTQPVRRRVALKLVKLGMDTRQVVARFEAERQALAMMDHPNIAKVLDGGATETGRPYFVMELVRGMKITDFCDQNQLSTGERLKLLIQVCQAIQHAHQKGVIHRDIKPSNVLVTVNDGVPVPKVIDFGIAKAAQGRLTDQTVFTAFEQFLGTPAYMSPEQAVLTSQDIDTRSDIYSLGVLLYELLTGKTPFDTKELMAAGLDALRRTIREREPLKPSTRLGTMLEAELVAAARQRSAAAPKLIHLVRGDLDWIVMRCLEKDRARRYSTANELAADLQHHLNDEPIVARAPSKLYRFSKSVQRNKLLYGAIVSVGLALLAGTVLSRWQARQTARQRDVAMKAKSQAEAINKFLTEDLLYQATPDENAREKQVSMEAVVAQAARKLDSDASIAAQPELEATLRLAIGSTDSKLGLLPEAERQMRRAVALRQTALGPHHPDTLLAQRDLVVLLVFGMNRLDEEAEGLSYATWTTLETLLQATKDQGAKLKLHRARLDAQAAYAWALANRGKLEQAVPLKRKNTADYERIFGPDDHDTINELGNLALILGMHGDYAEAEHDVREALGRYSRIRMGESFDAFMAQINLATYRRAQQDYREAETILSAERPRAIEIFGPEHPLTLLLQHRLAAVFADEAKLGQAESLAKLTLEGRRRALPQSGGTAATMALLGRVLVRRGELDQAEAYLQEARAIFKEQYPLKPELAASAENWLGAIQLARGAYSDAERFLLPEAERFLSRSSEYSPAERREAVSHIVELYRALKKPAETAHWENRLQTISGGSNSASGTNL